MENLGLEVNRLIRISFGPFQLLDLKPGEAEVIKRRILIDQLGPQMAVEFGFVEKPESKPTGKQKSAKDGHRPLKAKSKPKLEAQAETESDGEDD
jgi:23S rRNA pseudouridine2605 synthase